MSARESPFDGTWRPDPQRPGPGQAPDDLVLTDGFYECRSCEPPYRVAADGGDHPLAGNPRFDTLAMTVLDDLTVMKTGRRGAAIVLASRTMIDPDRDAKVETQTVTGVGPRPLEIAIRSRRIGAAPAGAHALSGRWEVIEADLVDHDEDTTFRIADGSLTMSDRMGRSYTARLDGTAAPYHGDPRYTSVTLARLDDRTIEESDWSGNSVVFVTRWRVEADGRTINARFDDLNGHVMEQTGHRLR